MKTVNNETFVNITFGTGIDKNLVVNLPSLSTAGCSLVLVAAAATAVVAETATCSRK
jgi:hypothetical protein